MNIQHLNLKIFVEKFELAGVESFIPVFHEWIQNQVFEGELLLDVADYAHVPEGPGVLLMGHQVNYSMDFLEGKLGLLYNRKEATQSTFTEQLKHAFISALKACEKLEQVPHFKDKLLFNPGKIQIIFNDRLLVPNNEETVKAIQPELDVFLKKTYPGSSYTISRHSDPRERLTLDITFDRQWLVTELSQNL